MNYYSRTSREFRKLPIEARLFLVGLLAIGYSIFILLAYYKYLFTEDAIDINQMLVENNYNYGSENLIEQFCKLDINAGYGFFYFPSDSRRNSYDKRTGGYYFIAYLEDNSVMAVKVKKSDLQTLEAISKDKSNNGRSSSTFTVEGLVQKMDLGDSAQKYKEALAKCGLSDNGDVKIRYIRLDSATNRTSLWLQCIGCMIVGILLVFGNVIFFNIKNKTKNVPVTTVDNDIPGTSSRFTPSGSKTPSNGYNPSNNYNSSNGYNSPDGFNPSNNNQMLNSDYYTDADSYYSDADSFYSDNDSSESSYQNSSGQNPAVPEDNDGSNGASGSNGSNGGKISIAGRNLIK